MPKSKEEDFDAESLIYTKKTERVPDRLHAAMMVWSDFWGKKHWRLSVLATATGMTLLKFTFDKVLKFIEDREGVQIHDPLLALFEPIDVSKVTFVVMYLSLIIYSTSLVLQPRVLIIGIQAFGFMCSFRILTMLLTPLEPPASLIVLRDPFLRLWCQGDKDYTKDLFFSGHTASMILMYLNSWGWRKQFLGAMAFFMAALIIAQHVHYTVDVVAAPFFAFGSHKVANWANALIVTSGQDICERRINRRK